MENHWRAPILNKFIAAPHFLAKIVVSVDESTAWYYLEAQVVPSFRRKAMVKSAGGIAVVPGGIGVAPLVAIVLVSLNKNDSGTLWGKKYESELLIEWFYCVGAIDWYHSVAKTLCSFHER